jgi:phosphatidylglycerol:prolipoprotein diacylglycerol transferase
MIPYPHINPDLFRIGALHVRWYGMMIAFFLIFYGAFRFFLEFFREPDVQLGILLGPLTMGQLLSAAMVGAGILVFLLRKFGIDLLL